MPLVLDKDGKKFGKSEGNALWLDENKTSSYKLYQYLINVDDTMVIDYLKIFTFLSKEEIEELERQNKEHPELREAHKALAREIITDLHGKESYEKAVSMSEALFTGKFTNLNKNEIEELFASYDKKKVNNENIVELLINIGASSSKREAREFVSGGTISINGEKVTDLEKVITKKDSIENKYMILRRGKKKYYLFEF
jgi:tyrosyl-tRNA synthetase